MIAYGKGGTLETVVGWPALDATGVFFDAQTTEALEAAVELFENNESEFKAEACRRNAERFGRERFKREFRTAVEGLWSGYRQEEATR